MIKQTKQDREEEKQESRKYVPIEISDLIRDPNMDGRLVQVSGIARGCNERNNGGDLWCCHAVLTNGQNILEIRISQDEGYPAIVSLPTMLRASSEMNQNILLQGRVENWPTGEQWLEIHGYKFQQYSSNFQEDKNG